MFRAYHLQASKDGSNVDFEDTFISSEVPGFWECYERAAEHGCDFFTVFSDEEDGEPVYTINVIDPDNGAENTFCDDLFTYEDAVYNVEQMEQEDRNNGIYVKYIIAEFTE